MEGVQLKIPFELAKNCGKSPEGTAWLEELPNVLHEIKERWSLTLETPFDSEAVSCSYVAKVVRKDGTPAVLKLGMPHMEGQHEIEGLRFWDGNPTVRLYEADEELNAMLLERCNPGMALRGEAEDEQDAVISSLLRRLWRKPTGPHRFRPLSALMEYWSAATVARIDEWPDRALVREGLELFKELPRSTSREVVLATDLHAGNVLRAEREFWLAIDPKPFLGDPAYDATQHLFNCQARLRSDVHGTIRKFAEFLGVDHGRVRLWMFARCAAEPRDDWSNRDWTEVARALAL
jgi:streptomycin 6-kinase